MTKIVKYVWPDKDWLEESHINEMTPYISDHMSIMELHELAMEHGSWVVEEYELKKEMRELDISWDMNWILE